jgi:site-specific DNA-cytosine methylase
MENVQGITNIGGGIILEQILEDFANIGYQVECKVINMALYGVPQLRKRAIFVGNNLGLGFSWPSARYYDARKPQPAASLFCDELLPFNSVNSALSDLMLPQGNYFSHRANSQMRGPRNRVAHSEPAFTLRVRGDEFALCEYPAESAFIPGPMPTQEIAYADPQNELQEMLRNTAPAWATPENIPRSRRKKPPALEGTRRLTIKEQARLQTFPDWVKFEGAITSQARQIGNAVPPVFSSQLFAEIFKTL